MYNNEKNARRAARKQGLTDDQYQILQNEEGKYVIERNATPEWASNEPIKIDAPTSETPEPASDPAPVAPDEMIEEGFVMPQGVDLSTPCAFVWAFHAANPAASRKEKVRALIDLGLNPNMTKTQTWRWYKMGGNKAAWLALEKSKRDAEKAKIEALVAEIRAKAEVAAKAESETAADVEASHND